MLISGQEDVLEYEGLEGVLERNVLNISVTL